MKYPSKRKEEFGEYDEPVLTEEQEQEMYGEKPEDAPEEPQSHKVEEAYEVGDKDIQEE